MVTEPTAVEAARIFEFLYAGGVAEPGPRGECSEPDCQLDAWVRTSLSGGWLCVHHYQSALIAAVRAEERAANAADNALGQSLVRGQSAALAAAAERETALRASVDALEAVLRGGAADHYDYGCNRCGDGGVLLWCGVCNGRAHYEDSTVMSPPHEQGCIVAALAPTPATEDVQP